MSSHLEKSVQDLFDDLFEVGDDLVIIDEWDRFLCGKLTRAGEYDFTITTRLRGNIVLSWQYVRFISHEGFPVNRLRGADGSRLIEKLPGKAEKIRKALTTNRCQGCGDLYYDDHLSADTSSRCPFCPPHEEDREYLYRREYISRGVGSGSLRARSIVGGDPFLIEGVDLALYNPGGDLYTDYEECLVMEARGGACAHLYDLSTVYHFEIVKVEFRQKTQTRRR